jgi:dihydrofolate reductase
MTTTVTTSASTGPSFACIVSMTSTRAIGDGGKIPWLVEEDMRHFYKTTIGSGKNAVIMGRNTWFSIPASRRPLKNRLNIILSTTLKSDDGDGVRDGDDDGNKDEKQRLKGCLIFSDFTKAIAETRKMKELETVWIIGGESIYRQALDFPNLISRVYITKIPDRLIQDEEIDLPHFGRFSVGRRVFDTWFPELDYDVFELDEEYESVKNDGVVFQIWGRTTFRDIPV